ncbi:MAG: hypothetical protein A2X37_06265 [Elusimicrobia bacterium GWA2_66_18]|nr:MAG: hypothetical protein A2X37_06265 [Elusimicrobia bacterium GWA2_66_18]
MTSSYRRLLERLREIHALEKAAELLEWDQQVVMPRGGGEARMEQYGAIKGAAHERFACDEVGRLIDAAAKSITQDGDCDEASMLRWARREWGRKRKLPSEMVTQLARQTSLAQDVWAEARAKNDFPSFHPALEKVVALKRRQAEALGPRDDLYDAWLEEFEPGLSTAETSRILADLKGGLVPLVKAVAAKRGRVCDAPVRGRFDLALQRTLSEKIARAMGFDFERGRLDLSSHPFTMSCSPGDVRLTTRYHEDHILGGLFGTMHETGHGLYEQGVDDALKGTPLCAGATMAMHESQSRLWENIVGRSRGFWKQWLPPLQELFPQAAGVSPENFYLAINKSEATFIRVEADELTYSLHILLRFELERDLLAGRVKVGELPQVWNERMKNDLGIAPPDDARGVLQDVHWAAGLFGYFPTYALGNAISVQLWEAALAEQPGIPRDIEEGRLSPLLLWLKENVHRHGKKYSAQELVRRSTGRPIEAGPYLRYLAEKYGEIYGL